MWADCAIVGHAIAAPLVVHHVEVIMWADCAIVGHAIAAPLTIGRSLRTRHFDHLQ
jgi:hypothetical protein